MSNQLRRHNDIIINGGGIVGFTLLNLIYKSPYLNRLKILLIEQGSKPISFKQQQQHQFDGNNGRRKFSNRVSSITGQSRKIFEHIQVWDKLRNHAKDVNQIKVWNYDYRQKMVFGHDDLDDWRSRGGETMFTVIENNRLSTALLENIHEVCDQSPPIVWNHKLESLEPGLFHHNSIETSIGDMREGKSSIISTKLLIGCDGFKSNVRDMSGIGCHEKDLNKTAIVGTVKIGTKDRTQQNQTAYQRFSAEKDTVAALLPLDEEHSSFVISAPKDYATQLMNYDDETFVSEFNTLLSVLESPSDKILAAFHNIMHLKLDALSKLTNRKVQSSDDHMDAECPYIESVVPSSRAEFPLKLQTTSPKMISSFAGGEYAQIALVGDSSHRVHPLAGQGLNLGIQDAMVLVEQLERKARSGESLFDGDDLSGLHCALKSYEWKRQAHIIPMMAGITAMPYLFRLVPPEVVSLANKCDLIKKSSIRFANGY